MEHPGVQTECEKKNLRQCQRLQVKVKTQTDLFSEVWTEIKLHLLKTIPQRWLHSVWLFKTSSSKLWIPIIAHRMRGKCHKASFKISHQHDNTFDWCDIDWSSLVRISWLCRMINCTLSRVCLFLECGKTDRGLYWDVSVTLCAVNIRLQHLPVTSKWNPCWSIHGKRLKIMRAY